MSVELISLDLIDANPWQPRMSEDAEHLANLATSIADDGLMQIPSARQAGDRYQLAFGHSRLAAYKLLASLQKVELLSEICEPAESESATARAWQAARTALDNLVDFDEMPLNIQDIDDETMFRFAVSENVQRRDLNAVETARAMKRYKDEFGKSSAEIGALFGVNDATVRGTIRLLDLPLEAQGLLARGEISQGAARSLLSMRNLVNVDEIEHAAKEISENAGKYTADAVVRQELSQRKNVVKLWSDDRAGKPRAGESYDETRYWLMDMRNFPNFQLEELTLSAVPSALEKEQDTQLLRYIAHSENVIDLKLKLQELEDENTRGMVEAIEILIDPPSCITCPFYSKVTGMHYCGLKACHTRKYRAWRKEAIYNASRKLHIPLYAEADGKYLTLDCYKASHDEFWKTGHADLRLISRAEVNSNHYPHQYNFKGVNVDDFVVIVIGDGLKQLQEQMKAERAEKLGRTPPVNRYTSISEKMEILRWEAAGYVAKLFDGFTAEAMHALFASPYGWNEEAPKWALLGKDISDEKRLEFYRKKIALNMIHKQCGWISSQFSISEIANVISNSTVFFLGSALPVEFFDLAREMEAEVDERFPVEQPSAAPVSVETVQEVEAE